MSQVYSYAKFIDMLTGDVLEDVKFYYGTTVKDFLNQIYSHQEKDYAVRTMIVRINRRRADFDQIIMPNDQIVVTRKDLMNESLQTS